jgi:hypothetical protein
MDALVPVVVGRGTLLLLDDAEPGIFAGRLVEVPVYADVVLVHVDFFEYSGWQT